MSLGLLVLGCLLFSSHVTAQEATQRVLVLHGVWEAGPWDLAIDRGIADSLNLSEDGSVQVSFQYLGIDAAMEAARLEQIRANIEAMVAQQNISIIVAVQPIASEFLLDLALPDSLPKLLLLPNPQTIERARSRENVTVVESASRVAAAQTLAHIAQLRPDTDTVYVVGGNNGDDLAYVQQVRAAASAYSDTFDFEYLIGVPPDELQARLQALSRTDTVLTLPFSAYTDSDGNLAPVGSVYFDAMIDSVPAPLFGIYDRLLGIGLVGGSLSSTDGYARTVGRLLSTYISEGQWPVFLSPGDATATYDWQEAQRFGIDPNQLDGPLRLINAPESLWDTNPLLVIAFINVVLVLLLVVTVMAVMLNRSRNARKAIAASEKIAREKEQQYRLLATNTVDVIWTWNGRTEEVTYCSPSITSLTGYSVEEFLAQPLHKLMTPESFQRCVELYQQGTAAQDKLIEVEHYRKDGGTVWCEMSAHPIDYDHDADTWVGVTRDITQRKREELHRERLEASVRQNQKFESLGTLAGGIAHDFNNVLSALMGLIDLLADEVGKQGRRGILLDKLDNSAQKAKRLVQRILAFARHREGDKEVLDLAELCNESLELIRLGLPPEISLEVNFPGEAAGESVENAIKVKVDRTQIEQIILNITTNAIEALASSGGNIRVSLVRETFESTAEFPHGAVKPGTYARLQVEDDGPGMPKKVVERIFDPFFTSKDMGSGMGLAIVRSVIVQHEGAVDVITQPGLGSRFDIYLPLTEEALPQSTSELIDIDIGRRMRVLIIDDQEEVLDTSRMMLENLGHECQVSSDPFAGMEIIDQQHANLDLVISDYSMPGLNGLDIANRCAEQYPELQVILTTGYGDVLPQKTLLANKRQLRILRKPFSFKELKSLLNQVMREAIAA